jgi:hypothetical protein
VTTLSADGRTLVCVGELPAGVNIAGLHRPHCGQPDQSAAGRASASVYGEQFGQCALAKDHGGDHDAAGTWRPIAVVHGDAAGQVELTVGTATHGSHGMSMPAAVALELAHALAAAANVNAEAAQ